MRGDGKGDSSTNQARSRMAQGWQGSSLLSLPDLPERVLRSFFLHLYLITRSGPVLKAEASWRTPQSVPPPPPPPLPSGEGGPRWLVRGELSAASPLTRVHWAGGCGSGQGASSPRRSASAQDVSLNMLYLWKSIFLLTNLCLTWVLLKQQPSPGQVNVTVAAVSVPRGLPASRIQLDKFVCKCFKYFSWYAIKE